MLNSELMDESLLNEHIVKILPKITKITSLSYSLDSARDISEPLFSIFLKRAKEVMEDFTYTGSYWSILARIAKVEYYLEIFNKSEKLTEFLNDFPNFEERSVPESVFK